MMEIVLRVHEFLSTGAVSQSAAPARPTSQPISQLGQPARRYRYSIIAETPFADVCFAYLPSCDTSAEFSKRGIAHFSRDSDR